MIDRAALIRQTAAAPTLGAKRTGSTVYLPTEPSLVAHVRDLITSAANPQNPEEVEVSWPSGALAARAAADWR